MIETLKFIPRFVKLGILSLVIVGLNGTVTQAQRSQQNDGSIDLLSLGCSTSGQSELVTDERENISVGKQIFTPIFYFSRLYSTYDPFLLTCQHTPSEAPQTLQLIIGIQDYAMQEKHEITFNAYLDGQPTASHVLSAGEGKTLLLDVTKTSSIALEAVCSFHERGNRYCPALAFLKASILPSSTSSSTNPNPTAFSNSETSDQFNNTPQTVNPPVEESSWGNSTTGEQEEKTNNSNSNSNSGASLKDTIEDVNTIIDIFK